MVLQWFEMNDLKKRDFSGASWVPLRSSWQTLSAERYGFLGYKQEYFGAYSVIVPVDRKDEALNIIVYP